MQRRDIWQKVWVESLVISTTNLVDEVLHLIDSIVEGCGDGEVFRNSDKSTLNESISILADQKTISQKS